MSELFFFFFSDGPAESRRKPIIHSSISSSSSTYSWSPASSLSPSDENPQGYFPQFNHMLHLKHQQPQPYQQHPKTICRHCKSHNMPECLYTCTSFFVLSFCFSIDFFSSTFHV